ncbi:hypothetical protein KQX54_008084 [Cotesia glomerata]|uniref:Uncharacterized protein n=1 Tax=Cotesia glomerata TaxID=32391 RepID=A0AAV7J520_COTGL|nr:hypothetical protein KQX54_008084 [Cotesia glomerata]
MVYIAEETLRIIVKVSNKQEPGTRMRFINNQSETVTREPIGQTTNYYPTRFEAGGSVVYILLSRLRVSKTHVGHGPFVFENNRIHVRKPTNEPCSRDMFHRTRRDEERGIPLLFLLLMVNPAQLIPHKLFNLTMVKGFWADELID